MRAFIPSETALVLGGGGAKGAYEVGAIAALDALGVKAGSVFGARYRARAELFGGLVLILMGVKILLEHLGLFG